MVTQIELTRAPNSVETSTPIIDQSYRLERRAQVSTLMWRVLAGALETLALESPAGLPDRAAQVPGGTKFAACGAVRSADDRD